MYTSMCVRACLCGDEQGASIRAASLTTQSAVTLSPSFVGYYSRGPQAHRAGNSNRFLSSYFTRMTEIDTHGHTT